MGSILTQAEADALIRMIKTSLANTVYFPSKGEKKEFQVRGDTAKDLFDIQLFRGNIASSKTNYEAIVCLKKIPILELHVGETLRHRNPDGSLIIGSHWHIYNQQYGRALAIPATDINSPDFERNTMKFFNEFNIVSPPVVVYQQELDC